MQQKIGLHIVWDLYECDFEAFIERFSPHQARKHIIELVLKSGLHILDSAFFVFENNSFSLNIMLSESHLCIHTWPERKYVSLDLFVCNYTCDNSLVAGALFDEVCSLFLPITKKVVHLER